MIDLIVNDDGDWTPHRPDLEIGNQELDSLNTIKVSEELNDYYVEKIRELRENAIVLKEVNHSYEAKTIELKEEVRRLKVLLTEAYSKVVELETQKENEEFLRADEAYKRKVLKAFVESGSE